MTRFDCASIPQTHNSDERTEYYKRPSRVRVCQMTHRGRGEPPHVVATLANKVPLRADCLSVPEMRAILTLSGFRALDEGHHHRKVVPVSLHPPRTCSNHLLRCD